MRRAHPLENIGHCGKLVMKTKRSASTLALT
jgi:hypothetical protein